MDVAQALAERRSVRVYEDRPVEQEKLAAIVTACGQAPKAGPFQTTVIQDRDFLFHLNAATLTAMENSGNAFLMGRAQMPGYTPLFNAPILILLSAPPGQYVRDGVACALTAMTLQAIELGLGSCYVVSPIPVFTGQDAFTPKLQLPNHYTPIAGLTLGYPGDKAAARKGAGADMKVNYI